MKIDDKLHAGYYCKTCTPEEKEANGGLYCHAHCEKYINKCKEVAEYKALIKKNKADYERPIAFAVDSCRKNKSYKERIRLKKK